MIRRYSSTTVHLHTLQQHREYYLQKVRRLSDPLVLPLVKNLIISTTQEIGFHAEGQHKQQRTLGKITSFFHRHGEKAQTSSPTYSPRDILPHFPNLLSLTFRHASRGDGLYLGIPLMTQTLASSCATLTSLAILYVQAKVSLPLLSGCAQLPRLRDLEIAFSSYDAGEEKVITDDGVEFDRDVTVSAFVNRHKKSIENLKLSLTLCYSSGDASPLFEHIERISNLRSAAIQLTTSTNIDVLILFLSIHSDSLRSLTVYSILDLAWDTTRNILEDMHTPLPKLKSLDFHISKQPGQPQSMFAIIGFVKVYSPSLTSLQILDKPLSLDDWTFLFMSGSEWPHLKSLHVHFERIIPEVFDSIETHIPKLESLNMQVLFMHSRLDFGEKDDSFEFCRAMSQRSFRSSSLLQLSCILNRDTPDYCITYVVSAFPWLRTVATYEGRLIRGGTYARDIFLSIAPHHPSEHLFF